MDGYVLSLKRLASAYREAEARIVRAYFKKRRRPREHVRWLKAQAFKEYSAIKPLVTVLARLHPYLDKGVGRHAYEELTEKLAQETKHARLILDLLEDIGAQKLRPEDLPWLREDRKLARVRARYSKTYARLLHGSGRLSHKEMRRRDEDLERAAITLTEGGGGALYAVCGRLGRGAFERKISAAFREIHRDEIGHKDAGEKNLRRLIRSRKDFDRAAEIIGRISRQRLRMRNEQFGFPLSEAELGMLERAAEGASHAG